jgi:hypothetical protein
MSPAAFADRRVDTLFFADMVCMAVSPLFLSRTGLAVPALVLYARGWLIFVLNAQKCRKTIH